MTKHEFDSWLKHTKAPIERWLVDPIHAGQADRDLMVYRGGVAGQALIVQKDGVVLMCNYSNALPHIGEASFEIVGEAKYPTFTEAVKRLAGRIGMPTLETLLP